VAADEARSARDDREIGDRVHDVFAHEIDVVGRDSLWDDTVEIPIGERITHG
jgi:hypothetical protein